jgi:WD40 repeat protein
LLADGKTVATTAEEFVVKLWDIESGRETFVLPGKGGINIWLPEFGARVVITPDGKKLAISNGFTNGFAKGITLWDLATHEIVNPSIDEREGIPLTFMVLSPDGKVLATGGFDGVVKCRDTATGHEILPPIQAHSEPVMPRRFHRMGGCWPPPAWIKRSNCGTLPRGPNSTPSRDMKVESIQSHFLPMAGGWPVAAWTRR